jgi:hypothetical protein
MERKQLLVFDKSLWNDLVNIVFEFGGCNLDFDTKVVNCKKKICLTSDFIIAHLFWSLDVILSCLV